MSYVHGTAATIREHLRPGQLVVLESTTYPGTTDEELKGMLEESGLTTPADFFLAFSPEREDPGQPVVLTPPRIPKLVGGVNPDSTEVAAALYSGPHSQRGAGLVVAGGRGGQTPREHLPSGQHRPGQRAQDDLRPHGHRRLGGHRGRQDQALRLSRLLPGPGLGGHCIPLDPFYLSWKAAEYGMWTRFIELAGEINTRMPDYVVSRLEQALAEEKKTLTGAKILVLGLSYKADIDDDRESPSYEIIELLAGARGPGGLLRPAHPRRPRRAQARPGPEVGAAHRRGVRQVRRPGAIDRPCRLQRPRAVQGARGCSATPEPRSSRRQGCRYVRA